MQRSLEATNLPRRVMAPVIAIRGTPGYDVISSPALTGQSRRPQFVDAVRILHHHACKICRRPLLDPVQTVCGQRVCHMCIFEKFGESQRPIPCPLKHDDEDAFDLARLECRAGLARQDIYNDYVTRHNMSTETVYCTYKALGCVEQMKWRKLEEHLTSCQFIPVPCPNAAKGCQQQLAAISLDQHKALCDYADVTCQHCADYYLLKDEQAHSKECLTVPASCNVQTNLS